MSLIYVTGISGSGKSEALKELRRRGYDAYGTDEDGISAFYDNKTGAKLKNPPTKPEDRTIEWRSRNTWKMARDDVEQLAKQSVGKLTFLLGVAANENEVWDLFSCVMALVIDKETLEHRIVTRKNNNFGKVPHELKSILKWQESAEETYKKHGVTTIDGTRPIKAVVNELVEKVANLKEFSRQVKEIK